MNFKEFVQQCNEKACNGQWGIQEALLCIDIIDKVNDIKITRFGFYSKKKTEIAREEAFQKLLKELQI